VSDSAWTDLCAALPPSAIRTVEMIGVEISSTRMEQLGEAIKAAPNLTDVALRACSISDEAAAPLADALAADPALLSVAVPLALGHKGN